MRCFLALLFCLNAYLLNAQTSKKGNVITSSGDTLRGNIKEDSEGLATRVYFSAGGQGERLMDKSSITGFGFEGGARYSLVQFVDPLEGFEKKQLFARWLVRGYHDFFTFWKQSRKWYVARGSNDSMYLLYDNITLPSGAILDQDNYRNTLSFFAVGCSDLQSKAQVLNYPEASLGSFFSSLNRCKQPSSVNAVFYNELPVSKKIIIYGAGLPMGRNYTYTGQVFLRLVSPDISSQTSLNVGLGYWYLYEREKITNGEKIHKLQIISIPVTIQYNFTRGVVQPYVYGGVGPAYKNEQTDASFFGVLVEKEIGASFTAGIGIEGYINQHWLIRADLRYELIFHYPVIGIAYRF
jgi:hypothetical protein